MSHTDLPPEPPLSGRSASPDDVLPSVEPPSAGFILQLFFIPLVIVALVVMVWLMFSWIAQAGSDPRDLVDNLKRLNDSSWQSALNLADQLKNPEYDHLKDDHALAKDLASVLQSELDGGSVAEPRLRLRIFLCRSLGEFRVTDGLDALLRAATQERKPQEIDVRAAAIEALALMAAQPAHDTVRQDQRVLDAITEASRASRDNDPNHLAAELRSRAAFALGVYGGPVALERLVSLLDDAYPNVRYNAATGLARQGDVRAVPALLEMLDPTSDSGLVDEKSVGEKQRKRAQILLNGVRAAFQLLQHPAAAQPAQDGQIQRLNTALAALGQNQDYPAASAAALEAAQRLAPTASP